MPYVESFALGVWINAGSRDEANTYAGTAHFIEHLIFRRTLRRSSRAIAAAFENIGAYTNAFTTKEHTCFYVRALRGHFRKCSALLSEIVLQPAFHPIDIEKERDIIAEEIKGYDDEPEEQIFDETEQQLFAGHPLEHPISGSSSTLYEITRNELLSFYSLNYQPSNMVFAVAGNINHAEAVSIATHYFSNNKSIEGKKADRAVPAQTMGHRTTIQKSFQQSHIVAAARIEGASSQNRFAYSVLNTAFGDGMSSRLYQRLRERSALAYTIYSTVQLLSDIGSFSIYASVDSKNTDKALRCITEEIEKLRQTKLSVKEIMRAKEQVKTGIVMGLEDLSSRMNYLAKSEIEEGGFETVDISLEKINAVTSDDILQLVQAHLSPEDIQEVIFRP